jgi:AraC-like DNA-binding protein
LLFHYKGRVAALSSNGKEQNTFTSGIHAQSDRFAEVRIEQDFGVFGVFLYAYTIPGLFGIAATEITNQLPDLYAVAGNEAKEIEERVMSSTNVYERIKTVCEFLIKRLSQYRRSEIIKAVQYIYALKGMVDIDKVASESFLSVRQFERKFKEYCGFAPKKFSRIVRFNSLISNYKLKKNSLTQVAYDFGYYDQSHFIEEFKEFSGINPRSFFTSQAFEIFRP